VLPDIEERKQLDAKIGRMNSKRATDRAAKQKTDKIK
jgi:hypothetical protein